MKARRIVEKRERERGGRHLLTVLLVNRKEREGRNEGKNTR
jgi:hypothetical protein